MSVGKTVKIFALYAVTAGQRHTCALAHKGFFGYRNACYHSPFSYACFRCRSSRFSRRTKTFFLRHFEKTLAGEMYNMYSK
jgi:hypothetical protein